MDKNERKRLYRRKRKVEDRLNRRTEAWAYALDLYLEYDEAIAVGRLLERLDQLDTERQAREPDALDEWIARTKHPGEL